MLETKQSGTGNTTADFQNFEEKLKKKSKKIIILIIEFDPFKLKEKLISIFISIKLSKKNDF